MNTVIKMEDSVQDSKEWHRLLRAAQINLRIVEINLEHNENIGNVEEFEDLCDEYDKDIIIIKQMIEFEDQVFLDLLEEL